jgi:hypothetical protein
MGDGNGLTSADLMVIEQRVTNEAPSAGAAYLLCILLGWVSAHRFYLGRPGTAILQIPFLLRPHRVSLVDHRPFPNSGDDPAETS